MTEDPRQNVSGDYYLLADRGQQGIALGNSSPNTVILSPTTKSAGKYDLRATTGSADLSNPIKVKDRPAQNGTFAKAADQQKPQADPQAVSFDQMGMGFQLLFKFLLSLMGLINPDNTSAIADKFMRSAVKATGGGEDDEKHTKYRQLKAQTASPEGRSNFLKNHNFKNADGDAARKALSEGAEALSKNGPQTPNERQSRVMAVMDNAAKSAGISPKLMIGVWGYESSWGKNLISPTGCQGDFQFSRTTMVETISKDGAKIAERLRASGNTEQAKMVEAMHTATAGMNGNQIKNYAAANKGAVDVLRMNPEASTYAASFYLKSVSNQLGVDPNQTKNFGIIYAGYNIGVGHAQTIQRGGQASGWEINANAGVAGKGNQAESYQNAMMGKINGATGKIVADKIGSTSGEQRVMNQFAQAGNGQQTPQPAKPAPSGEDRIMGMFKSAGQDMTGPAVVATASTTPEGMSGYKPRMPAPV